MSCGALYECSLLDCEIQLHFKNQNNKKYQSISQGVNVSIVQQNSNIILIDIYCTPMCVCTK